MINLIGLISWFVVGFTVMLFACHFLIALLKQKSFQTAYKKAVNFLPIYYFQTWYFCFNNNIDVKILF